MELGNQGTREPENQKFGNQGTKELVNQRTREPGNSGPRNQNQETRKPHNRPARFREACRIYTYIYIYIAKHKRGNNIIATPGKSAAVHYSADMELKRRGPFMKSGPRTKQRYKKEQRPRWLAKGSWRGPEASSQTQK